MTEALLTIIGCTLTIGVLIGWLARVLIGQLAERRRRPFFDEVFYEFRDREPVTSIRTLIESERRPS